MKRLLLAPGRALTGCACVLAVALAGCTGTAANNGSSVAGGTLRIWASEPPNPTSEQTDVLKAEQLALQQERNRVGNFTVKLVTAQGNQLSDNARAAIVDPTTIAYLGELVPGTSGQTIGITNAQDILQVSPTDTAVEFTQATPSVSGSPDLYYESLSANGRTFARVVPTDKLEAKALVGEMHAIGVKRLYARSDSTEAKLIEGDLSAVGITAASTMAGADGVLFAGNSVGDAAQLFNQAATSNPAVKLFGTSALATNSLVAKLSPAARRELYVSSPGFTSAQLPSNFVSAFKGAYGHAPATQAIFGYEAMAAVLATLQKAGSSANNRGTVVKDFFAIRNRNSPLGTYSIDKNGDISFANGAPFVLERVKGGKLEAVQKLG